MTSLDTTRLQADGGLAPERAASLTLSAEPLRSGSLTPLSAVTNRTLLEVGCNNVTVALFIQLRLNE